MITRWFVDYATRCLLGMDIDVAFAAHWKMRDRLYGKGW